MSGRDRLPALFFLALGVIVMIESIRLPLGSMAKPGPGFLPLILGALLAMMSLAILRSCWRLPWPTQPPAPRDRTVAFLRLVAACLFVPLALERLGFVLTMALFLAFVLGYIERRALWQVAVLAVAIPLVSFYLFNVVLQVPLPAGVLGR